MTTASLQVPAHGAGPFGPVPGSGWYGPIHSLLAGVLMARGYSLDTEQAVRAIQDHGGR
jgi:hypothetical protein